MNATALTDAVSPRITALAAQFSIPVEVRDCGTYCTVHFGDTAAAPGSRDYSAGDIATLTAAADAVLASRGQSEAGHLADLLRALPVPVCRHAKSELSAACARLRRREFGHDFLDLLGGSRSSTGGDWFAERD